MKFKAALFVNIGASLAWYANNIEAYKGDKTLGKKFHLDSLKRFSEKIAGELREIDCPVSSEYAKRLSFDVKESWSFEVLSEKCGDLRSMIFDEMNRHLFLWIDPECAKLHEERHAVDPKIVGNMPKAASEIKESGNAFASGLFVASVFYSMRAMEIALKVVSRELGIPDPIGAERNWGRICGKIETAIETKKSDPAWLPLKPFYDNIYGDLRAVKNAWRNSIMHVDVAYVRPHAESIFNYVELFLLHLSDKLKE